MGVSVKLAYATLRWRLPDLTRALPELKRAGWDGWEARLPLDWLGSPRRLKRVCDDAEMPLAILTANGSPEDSDWANVELNKRRMEFAAEMDVDCFMFMSGPPPADRPVTRDDIRRAAEGADAWARYGARLGLELSYHIHSNSLVDSIEDWTLYTGLLETAKLCIDVSHAELWGYDAVQAIGDFWDQLNYVHLQDFASCTVREPGRYNPKWVDVGEAEAVDFAGVLQTLDAQGFERWVTACPGESPAGGEAAEVEARRSATARAYLRGLGY